MRKRKNGRSISFEEEKIKSLLKSDIDCAAKRAGDWDEISAEAYESHDYVKRSPLPLVLSAACAAVVAAALGLTQLFTDDYYDIEPAPQAGGEDYLSSFAEASSLDDSLTDEEILSVQNDYLYSDSTPLMGEIKADYSSDEYGNPSSGAYRLTFDIMFPHEEGYTDYGGVYVYVICEGEVLYSPDYPDYYQAGTVHTVNSVIFDMKKNTAVENPAVTVIAAFVRDGSIKEISGCTAVGSINLTNPNFSEETAESAYANTENDTYLHSAAVDSDDNKRQYEPAVYYVGDEEKGIEFSVVTDICGEGYDVVYMTTGGAAESRYVNFGEDDDSEQLVRYYSFLSLDEITGAEDGGYIIAAAIPRDGGNTAVSPIYNLSSY